MFNRLYSVQSTFIRYAQHRGDLSRYNMLDAASDSALSGRGGLDWWSKRKERFSEEFQAHVDERIRERHRDRDSAVGRPQ